MSQAPNLKPVSALRKAILGAVVGLCVAVGLVGIRATGVLDTIEWRFVDMRTRAALGSTEPDPRIVIAQIGDADVDALKKAHVRWPWPLEMNTYAFQWLAECGVEGVIVDVYHFDSGAGEGELQAEQDREAAKVDALSATELANTYRRIGNVALAFVLNSGDSPPNREPLRIEAMRTKLRDLPEIEVRPSLVRAFPTLPVVRLLQGASRLGYANAPADSDGILRREAPFALLERLDPGLLSTAPDSPLPAPEPWIVPSLPMAMALDLRSASGPIAADRVAIGPVPQRLDPQGAFYVNFRGKQDRYPRVSPAALVGEGARWNDAREKGESYEGADPSLPQSRAALKGKIVVWGVNISGIKDTVPTPVSDVFPGPEFQATVLDNLLHGDGRVGVSFGTNAALLVVLCGLLGAVGGGVRMRGAFIGATAVLGAGLYFGASRLFSGGWSIDLFTPALGLGFSYAGVTAYHLLTEGKRNKWLEGTFSRYMSPAIIAALKANPEMLKLGGQRVEITVLFSDVKSFTSLSEKLTEQELVRLLNRYLTGQSMQVLAQDGVIDKFIGDAVMAFFGNPVPQGDHAIRACRAAVRCRQVLPALQPVLDELGVASLTNRIGLNTGPAVVGNMGSEARLDYTAMGNTVNLASRLEGANKAFGSSILLGPLTYQQAKDAIVAKPIAKLRVVGKTEVVAVYELLDLVDEAPPATKEHAAAYGRAHAAVLADDLEAAKKALAEAEALRPGDGPTEWLLDIVRDLRAGAIARPWNGTVFLESK